MLSRSSAFESTTRVELDFTAVTRESNGTTEAFLRFCGASLLLGGVLAALLNLVLTPMLPIDEGSIALATSTALGIRLPLAAVSVALTTLGCVGLYLVQAHRIRFGALAFLVAGAGGFMTFAVEWVQFTLVRDLAFEASKTLVELQDSGALRRFDTTSAIAVATFTLGWLAVAIVTARAGVLSRRGPLLLIAGMVLVAALGALLGVWGAVVGNVILGSGWALLGWDLRATSAGKAI
jgi:hypothetical protein